MPRCGSRSSQPACRSQTRRRCSRAAARPIRPAPLLGRVLPGTAEFVDSPAAWQAVERALLQPPRARLMARRAENVLMAADIDLGYPDARRLHVTRDRPRTAGRGLRGRARLARSRSPDRRAALPRRCRLAQRQARQADTRQRVGDRARCGTPAGCPLALRALRLGPPADDRRGPRAGLSRRAGGQRADVGRLRPRQLDPGSSSLPGSASSAQR